MIGFRELIKEIRHNINYFCLQTKSLLGVDFCVLREIKDSLSLGADVCVLREIKDSLSLGADVCVLREIKDSLSPVLSTRALSYNAKCTSAEMLVHDCRRTARTTQSDYRNGIESVMPMPLS